MDFMKSQVWCLIFQIFIALCYCAPIDKEEFLKALFELQEEFKNNKDEFLPPLPSDIVVSQDDPKENTVSNSLTWTDKWKRLPPLPWNKRYPELPFERRARKRPLPPLPWNKRVHLDTSQDQVYIEKLLNLITDLEYKNKNKRLPALPLDKRLPPLPLIKRLPPLPWNKRVPPLPLNKRIPPLPWNKRIPPLPLNKRLPPLPWNKRIPPLPWNKRLPSLPLNKRIPTLPLNKRLADLPQNRRSWETLEEDKRLPPLPLNKKNDDGVSRLGNELNREIFVERLVQLLQNLDNESLEKRMMPGNDIDLL